MLEVPRLPDNSGGDENREWQQMLPGPDTGTPALPGPEGTQIVEVPQGGDDGGDGEGSELVEEVPVSNEVEEDNTTAETSEQGEDKESELDKAIDSNFSADIFAAARAIGKPVENAMDVYEWGDEDKQALLDALANGVVEETLEDYTGGGEPEPVTPVGTPSVNPGESVEGGSSVKTEDGPSDDEGGDKEDDAAAAAAAAAAAIAAARAAENKPSNDDIEEITDDKKEAEEESAEDEEKKKTGRKKKFGAAAIAAALAAGVALTSLIAFSGNNKDNKDVETSSNAVTDPEEEDSQEDKEDGESIHDRSTYHGHFASEDGKTYNSEKAAYANFGESLPSGLSESQMKEALGERMIQPGQLAGTYWYMQEKTNNPNFGVEGAKFDTPDQLLEAMEANPDLHQKVYDFVMSIIRGGNMAEDTIGDHNLRNNMYMVSNFETGDSDTSNVDVVRTVTDEYGRKVYTVTFTWVEEDGTKHTDIFTFKEICGGQPLDLIEFKGLEEIPNPDPDPIPDPDPTPDPDPDPDPDPTPTPEGKTPFDKKKTEEGLEKLHVNPQEQEGTVSKKPAETAEYKPGTGNDGSKGEEKHEVAPDSNQQQGAQDPNEKSQDGSGKTVKENVEGSEKKGGANGEETAKDENRTPEDAAQVKKDEAGKEAQTKANEGEDRSDGKASETMTDDEAAKAFASGDI